MKCKRCGGGAVVEVRRHNAAFCGHCFVHHGKDSLALWDVEQLVRELAEEVLPVEVYGR